MTLELAKHVEGDLTDGLRRHPRLSRWISIEYPISVSTDDPGIFNTDPITELMLLSEAFQMSEPWHLIRIILDSISHSFESNDFKSKLCERFQRKIKSILQPDNSK
jgi:adenosine deaminase